MSRPTIGSAARSEVVTFRCTKAEKELIEAAAKEDGMSPGQFAFWSTIRSARIVRDINERVTQRHTEEEED